MIDRQGELPHWLAPYQLQQPSTHVSDIEGALRLMQPDIQALGFELQRQFGPVNFRGVKSHNVEVRRNLTSSLSGSNLELGIDMPPKSMVLATDLDPEDIAVSGSTIKFFWNQVGLNPESQMRGFIVLREYDQDVAKTRGCFDVGYVQKDENDEPFGFKFDNVNNAIDLIHGNRGNDHEKIESLNELFHDLGQARAGKVLHPLFAHGMYEAAFLMGLAIWNRRIKSDFFEQPAP